MAIFWSQYSKAPIEEPYICLKGGLLGENDIRSIIVLLKYAELVL